MCGESFHAWTCINVGIMNNCAIFANTLLFSSSIMCAMNYVYNTTGEYHHCTHFH